jgi:hypothetical protein
MLFWNAKGVHTLMVSLPVNRREDLWLPIISFGKVGDDDGLAIGIQQRVLNLPGDAFGTGGDGVRIAKINLG